jgi:hypothetical protein
MEVDGGGWKGCSCHAAAFLYAIKRTRHQGLVRYRSFVKTHSPSTKYPARKGDPLEGDTPQGCGRACPVPDAFIDRAGSWAIYFRYLGFGNESVFPDR